jgi:hypothetical protein
MKQNGILFGVNYHILEKVLGEPELGDGTSYYVRWTARFEDQTITISDSMKTGLEHIKEHCTRWIVSGETDIDTEICNRLERHIKDIYFPNPKRFHFWWIQQHNRREDPHF